MFGCSDCSVVQIVQLFNCTGLAFWVLDEISQYTAFFKRQLNSLSHSPSSQAALTAYCNKIALAACSDLDRVGFSVSFYLAKYVRKNVLCVDVVVVLLNCLSSFANVSFCNLIISVV